MVWKRLKVSCELDEKRLSRIHIYGKPAVNKQGFFGHGVLSRLVSLLVFTLTGHHRRIHNLHLRVLLSFENNRAC